MNDPKTLTGSGTGLTTMLKAALPSIPGVNQLPGVRKGSVEGFGGLSYRRPPIEVTRAHVDAYSAVCAFPTKDVAPLTYPHMLAFPLHMAIMTEPAFPAPAIGTVHLENSIAGHRPIAIGESVAVQVSVGVPRPHPKGRVFDFVTEARVGDELVWESTSTYLRRGRGDESAPGGSTFPVVDPGTLTWSLPGDLGRQYAAVSGDHNPIHLYPLTAKALGFPRQIAHGMWSLARCVAAIENRLPDAVRVDAAFKKPILLPGRVSFASTQVGSSGELAFALTNPRDGSPHLAGRSTAL